MTVHLCPVCKGRGIVDAGFYNINGCPITNTKPVKCRTCKGSGVLWHKDVFNIPQESTTPQEKQSNYNPEGDPKNKSVNWDNTNTKTILNDGFLGKVGI